MPILPPLQPPYHPQGGLIGTDAYTDTDTDRNTYTDTDADTDTDTDTDDWPGAVPTKQQ